MEDVISLPSASKHKKEETKRLNNLPGNFVQTFYRDWLDGIDFSSDTDFQQGIVWNAPSEDVKTLLLVTSEFGHDIQGEIDLYVINNRLNKATFRWNLDPISKIYNKKPKS